MPLHWLLGLALFGGLFGGGADQGCATAERTMQRIERDWPLRASGDPLRRHVQALGARLGAIAGLDTEVRIHLVRNLEPLAFALGGGQFLVSDGLIALVGDEAQLAAVLAHEISHQRLGHFCAAPDSADQRIDLGAVVQHFDLQREIAADRAAEALLARAGLDPGAMAGVLVCLQQGHGASAQLSARIGALAPAPPPHPEHDSPAFTRVRAQLVDELDGLWSESGGCRPR